MNTDEDVVRRGLKQEIFVVKSNTFANRFDVRTLSRRSIARPGEMVPKTTVHALPCARSLVRSQALYLHKQY